MSKGKKEREMPLAMVWLCPPLPPRSYVETPNIIKLYIEPCEGIVDEISDLIKGVTEFPCPSTL